MALVFLLSLMWASAAFCQSVFASLGRRDRAIRSETRSTMMTTLKQLLFSQAEQLAPIEHEWLPSIRADVIEDPAVLREQLATLTQQLEVAEKDWARLIEARDPESFQRRHAAAEHIAHLKTECAPLPGRIAAAERQRAAALSLARWCAALRAEVEARTVAVLEHCPRDREARAAQLKELDVATRTHGRLAARLAALFSAREFVRVPDALKVVRDARQEQIRECDLLRTPGSKPSFVWPARMVELLDVAEGKTPQAKEIAS